MYKIKDIVLHSSSGVCQIDDIREETFTEKARTYYVLHPLAEASGSTLYVPIDSPKSPLRMLLTEEEIHRSIAESLKENIIWIDNNNMRKAAFNEILRSDSISQIIALIILLHNRKEELTACGRKFSVTDNRILDEAQKRIHQEFSYALSIKEDDVPHYIFEQVKKITSDSDNII